MKQQLWVRNSQLNIGSSNREITQHWTESWAGYYLFWWIWNVVIVVDLNFFPILKCRTKLCSMCWTELVFVESLPHNVLTVIRTVRTELWHTRMIKKEGFICGVTNDLFCFLDSLWLVFKFSFWESLQSRQNSFSNPDVSTSHLMSYKLVFLFKVWLSFLRNIKLLIIQN